MLNIYLAGVMFEIPHQHRMAGHTARTLESYAPRWITGGASGGVVQATSWETLNMIMSEIHRSDGKLTLCTNRADFEQRPDGSFGLFVSVEGYERDFAGDFDALYTLARLGVNTFTLSHNAQNLLCTGCNDRTEGGLTHLGKQTLKVLEDLPMMVDLVHMSRASFWDAMDLYEGDLFVSHSNCDEVCAHPRNLTDEQIVAVAERNGVVGLNAFRSYVTTNPFDATLDDLLDHAMRMYDLVGPAHIAIGADYWEANMEILTPLAVRIDPDGAHGLRDQLTATYAQGPVGIESSERLGRLLDGLAARGLSNEDVALIAGESYLKMLDRVRPSVDTRV
ncbi:dipeptidase [Rhodococcus wratislaviensis]|uniref:Putative dipeptidase n=1 Tax=Rhodococcus wratislaviensis NBRC 100605 TaxID=1219028 RepID=X0R964_RHOWR|nr:membrane dipeptidase [Rhodococcus wratislaviensis]GAF47515.1 putative dipeptidase [Rhodococcus wratislaviensis NBRC 100605]